MNNYAVTFGEWREAPFTGDIADFAVFYVIAGPIRFPMRIVMTDTLGAMMDYHKGGDSVRSKARSAMIHIALPRFLSKLNIMEPPSSSTDSFLLTESFGSEEMPVLKQAILSRHCAFQGKTARGLICDAASDSDALGGKTSDALCLACNLPDDRVRCTILQHPSITGVQTTGGKRRVVNGAFCGIKTGNFDPAQCRPGGNECWRMIVDHSPVFGDIPADIGERAIDELTFLNLAFKAAFGRTLLRINDPRTVAGILLRCVSAEEFTTRVASVADALNNFDPGEVLDAKGKAMQGPLNRLKGLLEREKCLLDDGPIQVLRRVVDIRNSFPIHSGNEKFIIACRELGLEYPPVDWEKAWNRIRYHFWASLRALRQMIPTSSPNE